jgi:transcriptional regulator with XRE-family HTH domain
MEPGRLISAIRQQRGLTQADLAQNLGFTQSYMAQIERGWKPANKLTLGLLRRIAAVLDVSLSVLIDEGAFRMVFGDMPVSLKEPTPTPLPATPLPSAPALTPAEATA